MQHFTKRHCLNKHCLEARQCGSCLGCAVLARKHATWPRCCSTVHTPQPLRPRIHLWALSVAESAGHTVLLPEPQPSSWFLPDPSISPNLSPETRHKAAGQNLAAFNPSGEIRRLRAFSLLCSAAINLKRSRGRWKLHPNGQLVHERENEPFHGPSGYNLPHSIRFDYPYLNT